MKFLRYPLSIIAFALLFIYGLAIAWHKVGNVAVEDFWIWFPVGAGIYLVVAFALSKIKMTWELEVLIQVMFVLTPVLWYVNQKDSYKQPVYVFIVEADYKGPLEIHFNHEKDAPTNARSKEDTIYFKFDEHGRMLINESGDYVKKMMKKNLYIFHLDHTRERVPFMDAETGSAQIFVRYDSTSVRDGKLMTLYYTMHQ